jgi:hypothetical protein
MNFLFQKDKSAGSLVELKNVYFKTKVFLFLTCSSFFNLLAVTKIEVMAIKSKIAGLNFTAILNLICHFELYF